MTHSPQSAAALHPRMRRRRVVFPRLGNLLFGKLFQALTGSDKIQLELSRRAVANGLNKEDFEHAVKQARTVEQLPGVFLSISQHRMEKALYWSELGLRARARDLFMESALWALYAEPFLSKEEERGQITDHYRFAYAMAAPHFPCAAENVHVSYLSGDVSGYLRFPLLDDPEKDWGKIPAVIIFNAFNSAKEELHYTENSLLSLGIATLSFDYPGLRTGSLGFDAPELANSLHMYLSSRPEIDGGRIGLYGISLGGRLALSVGAGCPDRFKAAVSLSAPLELGDCVNPVLHRDLNDSPATARSALFELSRQTPLHETLQSMTAPVLIAGGGRDSVAQPDDTKLIYEKCGSSDKKLVICPSAGHVCYEMMPSLRHEVAQWLKERL